MNTINRTNITKIAFAYGTVLGFPGGPVVKDPPAMQETQVTPV